MFKDNLLMFLNENNLKYSELGKKTNIPISTISGWLNYNKLPDCDILIKLADYFGITIDELVGREKKAILEERQDNDITELIKSYKRLSERQKRHIKINIYTMLDDKEKLEKEINAG